MYDRYSINDRVAFNVNDLLAFILKTDIIKISKELSVMHFYEHECSVTYCLIKKSAVTSSQQAFNILFTRLLFSYEEWDEDLQNDQSPIYPDEQYIEQRIMEYFDIKNDVIFLDKLSTEISAKIFADSFFIRMSKNVIFQQDIMNKFPLISWLEIVDSRKYACFNSDYFIETAQHYLFLNTDCAG